MDSNNVNLYFVCDTTGSMQGYINSLPETLNQVFRVANILFAGKCQIHIVAYEDYCDGRNLLRGIHDGTHTDIKNFVSRLKPGGGGDWPEAVKTALNDVLKRIMIDQQEQTHSIVFHYTDAPPHHSATDSTYIKREQQALRNQQPGFDWIAISRQFKALNVPVFTFLGNTSMWGNKATDFKTASFYNVLGRVVRLPNTQAETITKATIGTLVQ